MANRNEHLQLGGLAGPSYSFIMSSVLGKQASFEEIAGACISSLITACLPDIIEPADHPNHRSHFHSLAILGLCAVAWPFVEGFRQQQLSLAEHYENQARVYNTPDEQMYWQREAQKRRFYAGLLAGLIPGYVSHLLADAQTPKGLPLIG